MATRSGDKDLENGIKVALDAADTASGVTEEFNNVREKLEKLLGMPEQAQIIWQPVNFIKIDDEKKAISILKLLETLDNCEDVQGVYSNFDIEDEIINKINI